MTNIFLRAFAQLTGQSAPAASADQYEPRVRDAVAALRAEDADRIQKSMSALSTLNVAELLAELCVWVEDVTVGRDTSSLIAAATLPLPENPQAIVDAVNRNDLRALHRYAGGDLVKLIASLLTVIASLQEAGDRV